MILQVFDTALTRLGDIEVINSLIWTRRYWSAGEFKLLAPFTETNVSLLAINNLILRPGDREAVQIGYVNIRKNDRGLDEIEVQGRFLSAWLGNSIMINQIITTATSRDILRRIADENLISPADTSRKIPLLALETDPESFPGDAAVSYVSEPYISGLLAAEAVAKAAKLGFVIETDARAKAHIFRVLKGLDRTHGQAVNRQCVFSQDYDNAYDQEYLHSVESLKTVAYVAGEVKQDTPREIVTVGTASGLGRRELFVNASDIRQTNKINGADVTMTLPEYRAALYERGVKELEHYAEALNFTCKINAFSNLKYRRDFDIGDLVTCADRRWGVRINARITEVTESFLENRNDIDVIFGESFPTLADTLNKMR